jgi:hypothetical protein
MELMKDEVVFIRNLQKEHYMKLLKEGNDTRHKGMSWIVQCLWDLEIIVRKEDFSNELDDGSKAYILNYAKKDYILGQIKY